MSVSVLILTQGPVDYQTYLEYFLVSIHLMAILDVIVKRLPRVLN